MVSVSRANLFHEKNKTIMSIGGIILTVFLMFTVIGVYNGIGVTMDSMTTKTGADIWIVQEGTSGSLHSPSILPLSLRSQFEGIDGIKEYSPLIRTGYVYKSNQVSKLLLLNGYNTTGELGKPWSVVEGSSVPGPNEIILDKGFAAIFGLRIGDKITLRSINFTISGLTEETNLMVAYMAFMRFEDATPFLAQNVTNSFLIKVDPSVQVSVVKARIEGKITGISVRDISDVAQAYRDEVLGSFVMIVYVLGAIALLVGVLVVGLLIYMLTLEKSKEFGIIKAIGATNFYLYRIVLSQSLVISMLGYLFGVMITLPLITLIKALVPEFVAKLSVDMVLFGVPLLLLTGIIASFIPVRRIASIEPALVFK